MATFERGPDFSRFNRTDWRDLGFKRGSLHPRHKTHDLPAVRNFAINSAPDIGADFGELVHRLPHKKIFPGSCW
jgi:hypothetical protein